MIALWETIQTACEWVCAYLALLGTQIRALLVEVPIWSVRLALALLFLALATWCLSLSREYVMEDAPRATWWNDPRRWAVLVMLLQIVLYLTL